jgi:hypothetical protein
MTCPSARFLLATILGFSSLLTLPKAAFAQGAKIKSSYDTLEEEDRPDRRAEWMNRGRTAPAGQSAAALRLRAHQQKMTMRAQRAASSVESSLAVPFVSSASWVALGPAPLASDQNYFGMVSGRATAVAIDPSDTTGNTVYAAGAYGGVWKSTNATAVPATNVVWTPVTDQQASLANGAVSVKSDGNIVLVGTGEPNNAIDSYYGVGILRSTDKGGHWTLIPVADGGAHPFAGLGFAKFVWLGTTNTVVAATATTAKGFDEGNITSSTNRGLYLSSDGGSTWAYQTPSDGGTAIAPISATDVIYDVAASKFIASIRYHGLYSSTNGTNWTRMSNQPTALSAAKCPATANATTCPMYRGQLAVVPGRDEVYFWFVNVDSSGNMVDDGIWRSINGGTWTQISEAGLTNCGDSYGCGAQQSYYNLAIAAIPDGSTRTDLYAGTVNLYKCALPTSSSSCTTVDTNLPNSWLNLTHVYGVCSDIAMVHPDQHGMDVIVAGGKAVMYFANDGGVYRALDGYTGLNVGSCNTAGSNQFDNLNATLGSMTQFVSFSIHPSDQNTVLGGTQDNGSPASTNVTSNSQFFTANGGDGGHNAIDSTNGLWYTANTDVSVQACNTPPSCSSASFNPVVSAGTATIGGDYGAFYSPYILDPQDASELLVGTCRVWRGSTVGAGFSALSLNFDTGTAAACTGNEINQVRSIAAGGAKDNNGFSNVVYATSDGSGPNVGAGGGEVWATTNASTAQMSNVTGSINPLNYTISSVALDNSDATGQTAYVGIMGFVGPTNAHVWKTTNAGQTWSAFGNVGSGLPDAPVNALLVDAAAGLVYAGTDVGVFVSPTGTATWTEVGPSPSSGTSGYLPNVPVSAIRMFNSGGTKKLRVSTYGRGLWEYAVTTAPDFTNVVSNATQTVFPTQTATFNGTLTASGGYNSVVTLTCGGTAPSTCTPSPAQVTPTSSGAAYTVSARGPSGDYSFTAHAVGTDTSITTHDASLTLHVVDFAVGAVSPNPLSVAQGASETATFQVSASGSFGMSVTLGCSGLPSEATCTFSPSNTIHPTSGSPVAITVIVNTTVSTPQASSTVTIQATTAAPSATRTSTFTLTVTSPPDFSWTTTGASSHTVLAGQTTQAYTFAAAPSGASTFGANVTFGCSGLPDSTAACMFSPASIVAGAGITQVSLTITTKGPNNGTGALNRSSQFPVLSSRKGQWTLTTNHDAVKRKSLPEKRSPWTPWALPLLGGAVFGIAVRRRAKPAVAAGLSASLAVIGLALACQSVSSNQPPSGLTVTPTSATVALGGTKQFSASQAVTWSVSGSGSLGTIDGNGLYTAPASGSTPATATVRAISQSDTTNSATAQVTIPSVGVSVSPTPLSLYPNVAGAHGWPTQSQQFAAAVNNSGNTAVSWTVSPGGGTIDTHGFYTAPATVPNPATVTVTATTQADSAKSGAATVNILTPTTLGTFTVTVTATEAGIPRSQTVTLTVQ